MTQDEMISYIMSSHLKKISHKLETNKESLKVIIKEFKLVEKQLKEALAFQGEDLENAIQKKGLTNER